MLWLYSLLSVILVSLVSLIGLFTLSVKEKTLIKMLIYFVSFSVGGLLGDALIHLLPEAIELNSSINLSFYIILGILVSFIIEKFIQWRHCHIPTTKDHPHPFVFMNLIGDSVHNFIDGLIIGASYLTSLPVGIATTVAIMFHEIPQEIGDFGVLIHGGFSKKRALTMNFVTALMAVAGTVVSLTIGSFVSGLSSFLIPFAAGSFIYIASCDLIPELHKETDPKKSLGQMAMLILGIGIMYLFLFLE
ncbi:MAG: ZIP family metal transporter [Candidatus Aenigmatarchaeota archaeon]